MHTRDAVELAIERSRSLLGRIVALETEMDRADDDLSEDQHDERIERVGWTLDAAEQALFAASEALLRALPEEHAARLRRLLAAHEETRTDAEGSERVMHARERALEALCVGLGVPGAAELQAHRESERVAREARWVIAERDRPRRDRQTLVRVLEVLHRPPGLGLLPLAERALRTASREDRVRAVYGAPLREAHGAVVDLLGGRVTAEDARRRVSRALEAYDAAEWSAIEA